MLNSQRLNILLGVIVVILLAIVAFFLFKQRTEVVTMQNTDNQAVSTYKVLPEKEVEQNPVPVADKRVLLTPSNVSQYNTQGNCEEDFNSEEPNEYRTYSSAQIGFAVELPYNSKWGSSKYRINPYDEILKAQEISPSETRAGYLAFGAMGAFEGCSWVREYNIDFLPAQSAEQTIKRIQQDPDLVGTPTKIILNGLVLIKYEVAGLCSYPTLQVIGEKYNYKVNYLCNGDFKDLENIVKTMKLVR